jgi:putative inorganic carbon (HCO3(-)) transporter
MLPSNGTMNGNRIGMSAILREPGFMLLLAYVFAWYTQLAERWSSWTGGLRVEAGIAPVLLLIVLFTSHAKKSSNENTGIARYIVLYYVISVIQVIHSWDTEQSWNVFTENIFKYSLMGLFIWYFTDSVEKMKVLIAVWLAACGKSLQEGVWGGLTGSLIWQSQGIPMLHGNTGLYQHPNSLSQLALGVLPFIYYLWPTVRNRWSKVLLLALLGASLYCILHTGSRTSYLGTILVVSIVVFRAPLKRRVFIGGIIILMIPLFIHYVPNDYKNRFMSAFIGKEAEGNSKEGRKRMYAEGWEIFKKHPLGLGIGNYPLANQRYFGYKQNIHCLYLEVLTNLGIHGSIVAAMLFIKLHCVLRKLIERLALMKEEASRSDPGKRYVNEYEFLEAVARSVGMYFVLRLFVGIFGMDLYGIGWWFIIGMVCALSAIESKINMKTRSCYS